MGVQLIDPIDAIKEFSFANGVPEYEKMFIFAELTAQRRGRTIILSSGNGTFTTERTINSDLVVNMLGPDKTSSNFTTDWSVATSGVENVYEGFGITKINVSINSSFVPVVTIDFVDIRGLAFFNSGKNSPYAVLHDFPPPMFDLTLKGYYGKSLTYQLHLVRQNTSFEAETGNYLTTAEFIARTFAPLTDVLFQYPRMFPLMTQDTIEIPSEQANAAPVGNLQTPDRSVEPNGIYALLKNIENTYQQIDRILENSDEKETLETKQKNRNDVKRLLNEINGFANQLDNKQYTDTNTTLLMRQPSDMDQISNSDKFGNTLQEIDNVALYNRLLKTSETNAVDLNNKLYLAIKLNTEDSQLFVPTNLEETTNVTFAINTLNNYRKKLIATYPPDVISAAFNISIVSNEQQLDSLINRASTLDRVEYLAGVNGGNSNYRKHNYAVLDITNFYQKLYKYLVVELEREIDNLQIELGDRVNEIILDNLEMKPTIRNIFRIICDDVDTFFNELRTTAVKAQEHHNEPANRIIISGSEELPEENNKPTELDPFPLYIEESTIGEIDNNCKTIKRKQRAYPAKDNSSISNQTTTPFPEVNLVESFINVYIKLRNLELVDKLRQKQDANGDLVFIPSTPYDSFLGNDIAYQSPYIASSVSDGVGTGDLRVNQIFNTLLNRFYVYSQYTNAERFYGADKTETRVAIAEFGGKAEASNIALSLANIQTIDNLLTIIGNYDTANELFQFLSENNEIVNYNNTQNSIKYGKDTSGFNPILKNKNDENFFGLNVINNGTSLGNERSGGESNFVDAYITSIESLNKGGFFDIFKVSAEENKIFFSKENVQIIKDLGSTENGDTRFVVRDKLKESEFRVNIVEKLADIFGASNGDFKNDEVLFGFLNDDTINNEIKFFLIVSIFTYSKSIFTDNVKNIINKPAIIYSPYNFTLYSGALFRYNDTYKTALEPLFEAFNNAYGEVTTTTGTFSEGQTFNGVTVVDSTLIDKDIEKLDVLSETDKQLLLDEYDNFVKNGVGNTLLLNTLQILKNGIDENWSQTQYAEAINNSELKKLYENTLLVNYSEITLSETAPETEEFLPLSETNENAETSAINQAYFDALIDKLSIDLNRRKQLLQNETEELQSALNDTDIKNQCYYSFKSISDKWLSGFGNNNNGFPFNKQGKSLIDQFIFVDRAFNDIGDKVVINLRPLLEFEKDFDSSVFSVMSRILALNGFEFFPLQNFMSFNEQDWEDSFKIHETLEQETAPAFVCMYVGGVSSKLKSFTGDDVFDDDGINDINNQNDVPDFYNNTFNDCNDNEVVSTDNNVQTQQDKERNKVETAQDLQFNNVKAFRVRFGEQEQAVFKNISLDTKEFKDTNESLAILSEIAQDESYATPVPKGQNLFNTFEQRSYSATIDMMGDMMIQPTQYFQLENIPLFSGAYLVLSVEHQFTANYATTSFSGVRILKYPVPYVTDPASLSGLKSSGIIDAEDPITRRNANQNAEAYIGMNQLSINAV